MDGGYAGPKLRDALEGAGKWTIQIVKRSDTAEGWRGDPPEVGCRTHLRVAEPVPQIGKRLGEIHRKF